MLNKNQSYAIFARHTRQTLFALAIAAVSFASCKDDDNPKPDGGKPANEDKGLLPEKDQLYSYKITDSEGSESSSEMKVINVKDSSGIAVYNIENLIQEGDDKVKTNNRAFVKDGLTTYELSYPEGLNSITTYVRTFAVIEDYSLTGFPQRQIFEHKGTVDSKLTFSKEPVRMKLGLLIPIGEDDNIEANLECKVTYHDGEVTKQEKITTPAGTFNCSKWVYDYELYTKLTGKDIPDEVSEVVYTVELWTAPGVGIVKTIEASGKDITTTELQKITKQ
ncbi:hypothetical protein [Dyadobacter sp. CY326]|uniref:TapB family protein n=1 Tax=Dyadobacter sp. CY326 TaxID=2907300 RepID=UPI001F213859|nr:hypothetical protein [Dyadobacter sp. CY326]MCE7065304.1 hypothetical protein [Dyadobacter sp. CY326]